MSGLNVLLIGSGGREHALAWKLSQSSLVHKIYVAPGNGGTGSVPKTENVDIGTSKNDFGKLVQFAVDNDIGLALPGPEQPLVEGIETHFRKVGIPVFGPSEKAARMEGSKTFSKDFMAKHNIPTAEFKNFTDPEAAKKYVASLDYNVVIKASGLAAGKGVLIPSTKEEAYEALDQVMKNKEFGSAGDEVVVEEFIEGDELSILSFSDGYTFVDLPPAQDHKRIGDNDEGLNTGGMGAYAPAPIACSEVLKDIRNTILEPTIAGMRKDGMPFVGILFTGIMLTKRGPKVLEYNVRFGDPETQTVLPLLSDETDFAEVLLACVEHRLDSVVLKVSPKYATTVVMAASGYPEAYKKGDEITVGDVEAGTYVFHAGTTLKDGKVVTFGGRVIAVTAVADSLQDAVKLAYKGVEKVGFEGKYNRKDIAYKAFRDADKSRAGISYESAGVSVADGNELVRKIKDTVKKTRRSGADADIGGFGGIFDIKAAGFKDPLIIAATDGVGTKLKIAQDLNIHNTVGIDLVAMNVNDLIVQGGEPLFFLDYFASGKLDIGTAASFVEGVAEGCMQAGCALVGGETAEMPGLYHGKDYDVNGTAVGAVERLSLLPNSGLMQEGNSLIGISSSGVHSNGFSLIRKVLEVNGIQFTDKAPWDSSKTVGESLLTPTKIYVKSLLPILSKGLILGMAHITGGGLVENVPRMLPADMNAIIDVKTWALPNVFKYLGQAGNVAVDDISKTLNMGIGMVLVVEAKNTEVVIKELNSHGEKAVKIGKLVAGTQECILENTENWY